MLVQRTIKNPIKAPPTCAKCATFTPNIELPPINPEIISYAIRIGMKILAFIGIGKKIRASLAFGIAIYFMNDLSMRVGILGVPG